MNRSDKRYFLDIIIAIFIQLQIIYNEKQFSYRFLNILKQNICLWLLCITFNSIMSNNVYTVNHLQLVNIMATSKLLSVQN